LAATLLVAAAASLAWGQTAEDDGASAGTAARFANLLAFPDEARILIDNQVVVGNTVNGEVSDFAPISSGQHRLKVVRRYGADTLLQQDIAVKADSKTTFVLVGGRAGPEAEAAPAAVIPLVYEKPSASAATDAAKTCTVIFVNGDLRGAIKISVPVPDRQATSIDLAPGRAEKIDKFPLGSLDLKATPLFKLASGDKASVSLDTFAPTAPATYYCIFYASRPNYPTRTLVLSTATDGSLGASPIMDTR
jgi:hypothetical protein